MNKNKIKKVLKEPSILLVKLDNMHLLKLSDKKYLNILYKYKFERNIDFENPQTFNEKLQWLKLYDRKEIYTTMVDKYAVKDYVAKIIGEEYVIPTIGIYDKFDDIDFTQLPNQFVMKCTHDSEGLVICTDKNKLNVEESRKKINKCLNRNYYYNGREWPYKNVKPRIIIEKYMEDKTTEELRDYKFLCFNGVPKIMFIATDRCKHQTKFNYYDMNFNLLDIKQSYPNDKRNLKKPKNFEKMIKLSKVLSKNIPHVRVDFYEVNGKVYFGELTFYHYSGLVPFTPKEWDKKLGEWIDIDKIRKK